MRGEYDLVRRRGGWGGESRGKVGVLLGGGPEVDFIGL